MLKQAGVATPADVDGRWRGDSTAFNRLMAAYEAPTNSDYAPYVDVNAARARFLQASSQPLFESVVGPLPMLEVLGASMPRSPGSESALGAALAGALSVAPDGNAVLPDAHANYADALRATRELFVTCKPGGPAPVLLEGAVGTAIAVNELPPARAAAVWQGVRNGACYRTMDARLKLWVDLFAAVAARDAAAMSDTGTRALETAPNDFSRDYALSAAVAGDIALKRPEVGGRLLELHSPAQGTPWATTLREATAGRSIVAPKT